MKTQYRQSFSAAELFRCENLNLHPLSARRAELLYQLGELSDIGPELWATLAHKKTAKPKAMRQNSSGEKRWESLGEKRKSDVLSTSP